MPQSWGEHHTATHSAAGGDEERIGREKQENSLEEIKAVS